MRETLRHKKIHTDVLVIGGGTAGCYAALTISRNSSLSVLIAEKANIKAVWRRASTPSTPIL